MVKGVKDLLAWWLPHTPNDQEVFMVHRNARPTPAGRTILVQSVLQGRPVDHVAKEMGVSHTCAHRWFRRYFEHGWAGMEDRSYRPGSCPHATAEAKIQEVLAARVKHREGPVSGERIRARRATDHRYDRDTTGALLPIDVTKPGPHPRRWRLAGPWPARGRQRPRHRLRLRPRRRGRSFPPGLRGGPAR